MADSVVTGSFTATGQSQSFKCDGGRRMFNLEIRGTFVGTIALQRSLDGGSNWVGLTAAGVAISYTAPCSEHFEEPEANALYRLNCSAFTSGTITYRLSH